MVPAGSGKTRVSELWSFFKAIVNSNLSGANGIGSSLLARFVQSSIDEKINPIEIIKLDKLSFIAPIQNAGRLRMRASGFSHRVSARMLEITINYSFEKAP